MLSREEEAQKLGFKSVPWEVATSMYLWDPGLNSEHDIMCGNEVATDSLVGSLGRCYSSSLPLEAMGGCTRRYNCNALIWNSSILMLFWHATTISLTYLWWSFVRYEVQFRTSVLIKKTK
ncbi:hypothetical protein BUALT_Bualt06G0117500 [Buddleja alternifolia]|uniref:Uncharacterized protein n=1 Tax=Buddleja alternifolia TaxID=168488 RepID=A0AAV6XG26_9LAMI|nr:hypothetical protein BUALT_Bualt06G0117500 [Buddleja alternifolia]